MDAQDPGHGLDLPINSMAAPLGNLVAILAPGHKKVPYFVENLFHKKPLGICRYIKNHLAALLK
jgi:hypothetical protein